MANVGRRTARAFRETLLCLRDVAGRPLPGMNRPGQAVVLMYHGVVRSMPSLLNWRHVSESDFDCHLRLLRRHCNVVPLAAIFSGDIRPDALNVAITFDDGFRNNFEVAIPLLQRHGLPASLFVTGANEAGMTILWPDFLDIAARFAQGEVLIDGRPFVKRGNRYICADTETPLATVIRQERPEWQFKQAVYAAFSRWVPNLHRPDFRAYWELMSDPQIRAAASVPGITIGSHGYYHNNLGSLPIDCAVAELRASKTYLESLLDREVAELAFPDGSYTPAVVQNADDLGFTRQLAVDHRYGESVIARNPLRRFGVYSMAPCRSQLADALAN
jgi:peptidoglycan/xylan/chitin deacetylase (PgdA/CDA1 family)